MWKLDSCKRLLLLLLLLLLAASVLAVSLPPFTPAPVPPHAVLFADMPPITVLHPQANIISTHLPSTPRESYLSLTQPQILLPDELLKIKQPLQRKTSEFATLVSSSSSLTPSASELALQRPPSSLLQPEASAREKRIATARLFLSASRDMNEESLAALMTTLVRRELADCFLVIVADTRYIGSYAVDQLARLPNYKQIIHLKMPKDFESVRWDAPGCGSYVFLLQDPSLLLTFASTSPMIWDYQGRFLLVGVTKEELQQLVVTVKGRKTQHIVGVIKASVPGKWLVYMNQLYWGSQVAHVTTWTGHTFTSRDTPFPDKISDLRGTVLKVVTFEWEPSTLYYRARNGTVLYLFGRDVEVLRALAPVFNFTIQFIEPPNDERWGSLLPNGSWDGVVGLLGRSEADLAIANLFINTLQGRDQFQGYTTFFDTDESCMMTRTEPPLPRWQALGLPFTLQTWLALLVGLLLCGPVLSLLAIVANTRMM
ncbi:uncharacterized protein [Cherax quadricarinatus]|uniref:uncharacterized protein n=1 Tax=Cherax quadricarinatus TaxID=27406 RepID=UPI00387E3AB7